MVGFPQELQVCLPGLAIFLYVAGGIFLYTRRHVFPIRERSVSFMLLICGLVAVLSINDLIDILVPSYPCNVHAIVFILACTTITSAHKLRIVHVLFRLKIADNVVTVNATEFTSMQAMKAREGFFLRYRMAITTKFLVSWLVAEVFVLGGLQIALLADTCATRTDLITRVIILLQAFLALIVGAMITVKKEVELHWLPGFLFLLALVYFLMNFFVDSRRDISFVGYLALLIEWCAGVFLPLRNVDNTKKTEIGLDDFSDFKQILHSETGFNSFLLHLQAEFSPENLLLWKACTVVRQHARPYSRWSSEATPSPLSAKRALALLAEVKYVQAHYIADGAPLLTHLDAGVASALSRDIAQVSANIDRWLTRHSMSQQMSLQVSPWGSEPNDLMREIIPLANPLVLDSDPSTGSPSASGDSSPKALSSFLPNTNNSSSSSSSGGRSKFALDTLIVRPKKPSRSAAKRTSRTASRASIRGSRASRTRVVPLSAESDPAKISTHLSLSRKSEGKGGEEDSRKGSQPRQGRSRSHGSWNRRERGKTRKERLSAVAGGGDGGGGGDSNDADDDASDASETGLSGHVKPRTRSAGATTDHGASVGEEGVDVQRMNSEVVSGAVGGGKLTNAGFASRPLPLRTPHKPLASAQSSFIGGGQMVNSKSFVVSGRSAEGLPARDSDFESFALRQGFAPSLATTATTSNASSISLPSGRQSPTPGCRRPSTDMSRVADALFRLLDGVCNSTFDTMQTDAFLRYRTGPFFKQFTHAVRRETRLHQPALEAQLSTYNRRRTLLQDSPRRKGGVVRAHTAVELVPIRGNKGTLKIVRSSTQPYMQTVEQTDAPDVGGG